MQKLLAFGLACLLAFFSEAQVSRMDITHYNLNLDFTQTESKTISGVATLSGFPESSCNSLLFDLLKLPVTQVISGKDTLTFSQTDSTLLVFFNNQLQASDSVQLRISYSGQPLADSRWGGFYFSGNYSFNMGVAFSAYPHNFGRCWFPCNDNFIDRATYSFQVKTDSGFAAICSGKFLGSSNNTWNWSLSQPIPTYLASVAVGKYAMVSDVFEPNGRKIPIILASEPKDTHNFIASFTRLKTAISCFEERFGPYLFDRVGFVGVPFNSGAMEHAANIAYPLYAINGNSQFETLMAHELSHHWWGNLATCSTSQDMWLNEGWASFCEALFLECAYGEEAYQADIADKLFEASRWAHVRDEGHRAISGVPPSFTYGTHVYTKGALMVHNLRAVMGDEAFFAACKSYLQKFKFKDVTSLNLRDEFQKFTNLNLQDFFNVYIFAPGNNCLSISHFSVRPGDAVNFIDLRLRQHVTKKPGFFSGIPCTVRLYSASGAYKDYSIRLNGEVLDTTLLCNFDFYPEFALINPNFDFAFNQTYELKTIKGTGVQNLPNALFTCTVQSNSDSTLLLAEHYFTGPNKNEFAIPGIAFSAERFWRIDGNWNSDFKATAFFNYDGSSPVSKNGGGLDNELITGSEDDLVLLYRPRPDTNWVRETNLTFQPGSNKTDKTGRFWVNQLKKGEYCMGILDAKASIQNIKSSQNNLRIFPNPVNNSFTLELPEQHLSGKLVIYSINGKDSGQIMQSRDFSNNNTKAINLDCKSLPAGTYLVQWTSGKQVLKEKFIKE